MWHQRISWWSALALLRAVSSSPAAAAQTLAARALGADEEVENIAQLDILGSQSVFDLDSGDESTIMDTLPGSNAATNDDAPEKSPRQTRYRQLAKWRRRLRAKKTPSCKVLCRI